MKCSGRNDDPVAMKQKNEIAKVVIKENETKSTKCLRHSFNKQFSIHLFFFRVSGPLYLRRRTSLRLLVCGIAGKTFALCRWFFLFLFHSHQKKCREEWTDGWSARQRKKVIHFLFGSLWHSSGVRSDAYVLSTSCRIHFHKTKKKIIISWADGKKETQKWKS